MRGFCLILLIASAAPLAGCATRWQPQGRGPIEFSEACPDRRAPAVEAFGENGVRGVYHFVTQDASDSELGALIQGSRDRQFSLAPITVNMNGRDTMFVMGPAALRSQSEVDAEFQTACRLGLGRVYLTHVRYDAAQQDGEYVRVR